MISGGGAVVRGAFALALGSFRHLEDLLEDLVHTADEHELQIGPPRPVPSRVSTRARVRDARNRRRSSFRHFGLQADSSPSYASTTLAWTATLRPGMRSRRSNIRCYPEINGGREIARAGSVGRHGTSDNR